MKINVVCHDLSNNCLGRAHVLARLLARTHDVDIVGRMRGDDLWEPLRCDASADSAVPLRVLPRGVGLRRALAALDGDLVYAVKPKAGSLGLGLLARARSGIPLIADIDDWEMAFFLENPRWLLRNALEVWNPNNLYTTWAMERMSGRADAITVSTTFLQRRFGGTIIPHARSAEMFRPTAGGDARLRGDLGLAGKHVLLFVGSLRPHKGVGDVIAALDALSDPSVAFLVVGPGEKLPDRPYLRVIGPQPFSTLPRFLALADVVVLAQRRNRIGAAQLPAKVFDAMAMARPVIATRVSDLPEVLEGCGVIVEPNSIVELAQAIARLVANPEERARLGSRARQRFIDRFSDDVVAPALESVVDEAMALAGR
ncbi:MAG TPA: glycosyltransferase [Actinomycetota bacterium]|nr:glycosyltransferase [Actinomycetota bacterium]